MDLQIIRNAPEQEEHQHCNLAWDWKRDVFICGECGAELCIPELSQAMLLSVASE